jgi:ubiquinol-cytochrome c reductase cytochrome b subunit
MSWTGRIAGWVDERTGWRAAWQARMEHPIVGGAPWSAAIAASVAACFVVLLVTGLTLMTVYAPSPQAAWPSVFYLQYVLPRGWIVRGLHAWAAQALLLLALLHVVHGAMVASYRKPREVAWWLTLATLGLVVGGLITGGLLPWDQRGWWARVVEGNIAGLAPVVGSWLQGMLSGGTELGALGLTRAYAVHVAVVPMLLAAALRARRTIVERHGWTEGGAASPRRDFIARELLVASGVVFALFAVTGTTHGVSMEGPADPTSDYPARPEWYLMPLYELRHFFHGPTAEFLGTSLVPAAAALYLALLPRLDAPKRPRLALVGLPVALIFGGAVALGWIAVRKDARDATFAKQRAKIDRVSAGAIRLAAGGIPPEGALAMVRNDPEMHGRELFEAHCASCHVMGDLGDPEKATATKLDGWGTAKWIAAMIHDPDAPEYFGRGPFKGKMPSVDVRPADKAADEPWSPMTKSDAEKQAVAAFLANEGNEPDEPPVPADPVQLGIGGRIVSDRCTTCHLFKGDGDLEDSDVAPELSRYGSIAWTRAQIANPASADTYREKALDDAMKKHMPRFDKELSVAEIDLLARWTRAHGRGQNLP